MTPIPAVYEHGVFRPTVPVQLPEGAQVNVVAAETLPRTVAAPETPAAEDEATSAVYEILSRRYHSGFHDTAERHNEHQP